jgi:hypothetical protein
MFHTSFLMGVVSMYVDTSGHVCFNGWNTDVLNLETCM